MKPRSAPLSVSAAAVDFQGPLDRLRLEPISRLLMAWPVLGAGFLSLLVTSAAMLPVDVVVVAQGKLAVDAPAVVLRPISRAVLIDLPVRPGDRVRRGDILARLDPFIAKAEHAALLAEARKLADEIAWREAELAGQPPPAGANAAALRQTEIQSQEAAQSRAIAALQQVQSNLQAELVALTDQHQIAVDLEQRRLALAERKLGSELDAMAARSSRLAAEIALSAARTRLADTNRQIVSLKDEIAVNKARRQRETAETLSDLRLRADQIAEALGRADRLASLSVLVAPRDGVVVSVAPGGVGTVMTEADAVVTVVPSDAALLAEVTLDSSDLGQVAVGDPVRLKVDAFPWRRHGEATGVIESLAPLSLQPEGGGHARHPVRIRLTALPDRLPPEAALSPGMTLTADVATGTRSLLGFFTDPFARGLAESLREP